MTDKRLRRHNVFLSAQILNLVLQNANTIRLKCLLNVCGRRQRVKTGVYI